jgi:hypothetical protein
MIPFGTLSLTTKLIAAAGAVLLIGVAYWAWHTTIYNRGWHAAIEAVAAQDKEAVDASEKARARVRDCYGSGGVWSAGTCERGRR